ncbi:MAG: PotD/PotF family extracellular solute-binding protein, partial [Candidatus Hodarchaeota archaeon]
IPNFEKEFGIRIRYAVYESNEEMLAKVMSGNSGWDVVFPSNSYIRPMRDQGLLTPLRRERLTNLDFLDAQFRSPSWDPKLEWCVPYMWGATGIAYNRELSPPPTSWTSLWGERLKGRLTMLDDAAEVIGACLKKLGFSFNSEDASELQLARREAIAQKPLLRAYLNAEVRDQLVAGDVLAAHLWGTTAQQAIDASDSLGFHYPSEGFPLYADNAVILRESRRSELAHLFINYLLRPEVSAAVANATKTATANAGAWALLPESLRNNRTLYPTSEDLERGEWWETPPPAIQRLRDRLWTEIKSA